MKKSVCISAVLVLTFSVFGQKLPEFEPTLGKLIDKSPQKEIEHAKLLKKYHKFCDKIYKEYEISKETGEEIGYEKMWEKEKKFRDEILKTAKNDENFPFDLKNYKLEDYLECNGCNDERNYWSVFGPSWGCQCSWYCGAGEYTVKASSYLKPPEGISYPAKNISDFSYRTAWVVPDYGIGEYVIYRFKPQHPRVTDIIIVNGYVKSEEIWKDNSRVKKLKMYINDKPVAILNLADSRQEQHFKFSPIGYPLISLIGKDWRNNKREVERYNELQEKPYKDYFNKFFYKYQIVGNRNEDKLLPEWSIKFEILDVYKGDKYSDVAITEIYFDGIDTH